MEKEFYLLDYKGKYTIISDDDDEMCNCVGKISKEDFFEPAPDYKPYFTDDDFPFHKEIKTRIYK